ncbi:MAG: hypothetical protein FWH57_04100 [Oscillospiraceae bacterium]|nr:hypothetical protein [Oscillospiraceae bacterium]
MKTVDEAKAILIGHHGYDNDEGNCYLKVGNYFGESDRDYSFVCWPYSDENPVDPLYAFRYWVDKESGKMARSNAPLRELHEGTVTPSEYGFA